jgi:hypothetical protein
MYIIVNKSTIHITYLYNNFSFYPLATSFSNSFPLYTRYLKSFIILAPSSTLTPSVLAVCSATSPCTTHASVPSSRRLFALIRIILKITHPRIVMPNMAVTTP